MIVLAGSILVNDADYVNDIDVVLLIHNVGKYVLLSLNKNKIEEHLSHKYRVKISFTPFLIWNPYVIGNLFLAVNMLRYKRNTSLIKFTLKNISKRWLAIHGIYAILGILCSNSTRDRLKYASMLAENYFVRMNMEIPRNWKKTIKIGVILTKKKGLHNISNLLQKILTNTDIDKNLVNLSLKEFLSTTLGQGDPELIIRKLGIIDELGRIIHEKLFNIFFNENIKWRKSVSILIKLSKTILYSEVIEHPSKICMLYMIHKSYIPCLSPFARP